MSKPENDASKMSKIMKQMERLSIRHRNSCLTAAKPMASSRERSRIPLRASN